MSTPEKPRPSIEETLRRINDLIAELPPDLPFGYVTPAERDLVLRITGLDTSAITRTPVDGPALTEKCERCPRLALPGTRRCVQHTNYGDLPAAWFTETAPTGHRRSCQHDGPRSPDCPGCTEIDELLTIAHINAAPTPPAAEPERGWLTRALHRLFG